MTSASWNRGKWDQPVEIKCDYCGRPTLWVGGRPRKYCSKRCYPRNRLQFGPPKRLATKLTPDELKRRSNEKSRRGQKLKREHQHELVRAKRLERGSCLDCGLTVTDKTMVCFAWDHRDPAAKSFTISQRVGRGSDQELLDEIEKCDLVCHNCHAIRTMEGRHWEYRREPHAPPTVLPHETYG